MRARLTTAAPGDAGALCSPGAPPGNVSISCRLLPAGARAPSGGAEPWRAAGSGPAPPQVGEVPRPRPPPPGAPRPLPPNGRRRLRAVAEGRGRRRRWRTPGASRAARCSPRAQRLSGAGGRVPSAGREWARPHKLCENRFCAGGHKVCCLPVGSLEAAAFAASCKNGVPGDGAGRGGQRGPAGPELGHPDCAPSCLGRRPAGARRGRGKRAGGSRLEWRAFRGGEFNVCACSSLHWLCGETPED